MLHYWKGFLAGRILAFVSVSGVIDAALGAFSSAEDIRDGASAESRERPQAIGAWLAPTNKDPYLAR